MNRRVATRLEQHEFIEAMLTHYADCVDGITPSQRRALRDFFWQVVRSDFLEDLDNHEFKDLDVEWLGAGGILVANSTVGMKGDEGTLASALCRSRRQLFIGPQGGLRAYGDGNKKLTGRAALYHFDH